MNYPKYYSTVIVFFLSSFIFNHIEAVPAYPHLIKKVQPNGDTITVRLKGDEVMKWMETEDGYSLLYDENKYIVYATTNNEGDMIPSSVVAQSMELRSSKANRLLNDIPKKLQYSQKQKDIFKDIRKINNEVALRSGVANRSATGTAKAICALIEFQDKAFYYTRDDFDQLMNQIGYSSGNQQGSVRDFYRENSYGKLDLIVTVVGPVKAKKKQAYYGENDYSGNDKYAGELAREAADFTFLNPNINPDEYDNDKDGYIDAFHFIFAGYGEESGGNANCIWSHMSGFDRSITYGNKKLNIYSCSPELQGNSGRYMTHIGVICHELGHIFGAPDFYDTNNGDFEGTGNWDLMASGSWNNNGISPAHFNMYQKIQFGWVEPVILSSPTEVTNMPNSAENPVAYLIPSHIDDEYYVLENRQKVLFDAYVPGYGLLIYHVSIRPEDIRTNSVNSRHPQRIYPVAAISNIKVPNNSPTSYGNINSFFTPFPYGSKTAFSDSSVPSSTLWNGDNLGKPVFNIIQENDLISFTFLKSIYDMKLLAFVSDGKIHLEWGIPQTQKNIVGYNIYRNGQFIQSTLNNRYRENIAYDGTIKYGVSVKFEDEESAVQEVEITYPPTSIDHIENKYISVYPNPVRSGEYLNIEHNGLPETTFSIYTLSGQLLSHKEIHSLKKQERIDLPAGIYMIKIKNNLHTQTFRLVVK
ncbi:MAG: M6 family metalloprotease domain-containing protein [Dysgonamonadaceae bacterium]|jgi:M6 family metalloprotease-like protein|nr:M6 family metalloprotease domain-containing protein [Dysgonamonadaceae bacterium]